MLFFMFTARSGSKSFLSGVGGNRKHFFKTLTSLYLSLDFKRRVELCLLEGLRRASVQSLFEIRLNLERLDTV